MNSEELSRAAAKSQLHAGKTMIKEVIHEEFTMVAKQLYSDIG